MLPDTTIRLAEVLLHETETARTHLAALDRELADMRVSLTALIEAGAAK